jgi:hypothetical protein
MKKATVRVATVLSGVVAIVLAGAASFRGG